MKLSLVIDKVKKWLLLEDARVINVLLGAVVANLLRGDPVWLFLIAPPSSAKSELIRALNDVPQIYPLSDLTPQTFISGKIDKSKKCSLLPHLSGKILTFKDFTTVLSMHRDKRAEILSQLREIYDGHYRKAFGTGEVVSWAGKVGFISGVTPIIDTHYAIYTVLGERFIQYRFEPSDPILVAKRAVSMAGREKEMREELRSIFAQFIKDAAISIPKTDISIPDKLKEKLIRLSAFCVRARSGIVRDGYSREIVYTPEPEAPARLVKQLSTLACSLAIVNNSGKVSAEDYRLIYRIGMDTLHKVRRGIIYLLKGDKVRMETSDIAQKIHYPTNTIRRYLEDLKALELVCGVSRGKGKATSWQLSELAIDLLEGAVPYPECQKERV